MVWDCPCNTTNIVCVNIASHITNYPWHQEQHLAAQLCTHQSSDHPSHITRSMSNLALHHQRPRSTNCTIFRSAKILETRPRGPLLGAARKPVSIATSTETSIQSNSQIQCNTPIKPWNRSHTWYSNPGGINYCCIMISHCGQHFCVQAFTDLLKFTFDCSNRTFHLNQGRATLSISLSWAACYIDCPLLDFGVHIRVSFASHILCSRLALREDSPSQLVTHVGCIKHHPHNVGHTLSPLPPFSLVIGLIHMSGSLCW